MPHPCPPYGRPLLQNLNGAPYTTKPPNPYYQLCKTVPHDEILLGSDDRVMRVELV